MPTRKTSSSKSRTTSSKNSTGRKATKHSGISKQTKSSSPKSKTAAAEEEERGELDFDTIYDNYINPIYEATEADWKDFWYSPEETAPGAKHTRSKDLDLFPHNMFPWRFEPRGKCDQNLAWFQCLEHVEKHVARYHLKPTQYKGNL